MSDIRRIIDFYNTECVESSDYRIAEYLLRHINEVEGLSMDEIAQGSFVSKSTVSRFVRKFGFTDYKGFLAAVHDSVHGSHLINLRVTPSGAGLAAREPERFFDGYIDDIRNSLADMKEAVDPHDLEKLISLCCTHPVALFAYDQPLFVARELQYAFLRRGVLVRLGESEEKNTQIAEQMEPGSLAVVFSNYGAYVTDHREMLQGLQQRGVCLWLVTLCYTGPLLVLFDKVVRLSKNNYSPAGIHPMTVLVEYLIRRLAFAE